jgi:hypothetical protein
VTDDESYFFRVTEAIFVGWFTLEYIIRFLVAPDKVIELCTFSRGGKGGKQLRPEAEFLIRCGV